MKYKHIPCALHNFAHSFLSLMNWANGDYVEDIVYWLASCSDTCEVEIDFSSGRITPERAARNPPLLEAVEQWHQQLLELLPRHRIDPARLQAVTLRVHMVRQENLPAAADISIQAHDDRGREYRVDLPRRYPFQIGKIFPCFEYRGW